MGSKYLGINLRKSSFFIVELKKFCFILIKIIICGTFMHPSLSFVKQIGDLVLFFRTYRIQYLSNFVKYRRGLILHLRQVLLTLDLCHLQAALKNLSNRQGTKKRGYVIFFFIAIIIH